MNRWGLVTGSEGYVRLWDPVTGRQLAEYRLGAAAHSAPVGMVWRVALGETQCVVAYRADNLTFMDVFDYSSVS